MPQLEHEKPLAARVPGSPQQRGKGGACCAREKQTSCPWLQVCLAYRNGEAKVVVVLCQREKLEMETTFRRIIPESQRFSTQFVFRQGSPLVPDDLRMVAASLAAATIIVSDSSR